MLSALSRRRRVTVIRPYRLEDESLLFGTAKAVFGGQSAWSDRRTLEVLEGDIVFVAEVEGLPAGFVAVEQVESAVRIEELLVGPGHEAEGVGRQLLAYAEGYAISAGAHVLQVVVEQDNLRALAFYRGRGFVPVAEDLLELVLPQA